MTSLNLTRAQNAATEAAKAALPNGDGADRAAFLVACAASELTHHDALATALRLVHDAMTGDPDDILGTIDAAAKELVEWAEAQDGLDHAGTRIAREAA